MGVRHQSLGFEFFLLGFQDLRFGISGSPNRGTLRRMEMHREKSKMI